MTTKDIRGMRTLEPIYPRLPWEERLQMCRGRANDYTRQGIAQPFQEFRQRRHAPRMWDDLWGHQQILHGRYDRHLELRDKRTFLSTFFSAYV
jgi:hypothetical protein